MPKNILHLKIFYFKTNVQKWETLGKLFKGKKPLGGVNAEFRWLILTKTLGLLKGF